VLYLSADDISSIRVLVQQSVDKDNLGLALERIFLEVMCANARDVQGGWMHVFLLNIDNNEVKALLRSSLRAQTSAPISMACTVHTCGACAHSAAGHDTDAELRQLENTCYAAKQCGVERCAGTLVNMRKPLCNLGKVLTSELHSVRVLLQALWRLIAGKISSVVELTHKRREHYELLWPDKAMQQTTCTPKDTIVSMAATITSLLGAVSHIMLDVSLANGHSSTNIDARAHAAHARFIMVLSATTNMLSAVILYPVYSMIVFQKFITCTVTDVSVSIMSVVDAAGNKKQPSSSIKFKDNIDVATEKDAVSPVKNEYFNKHITVGVKTPKKWEYSLKLGTSDKDAQTYELMNNVLEGKIKKSFELKKGVYPYFAARFGEKTFSAKTKPYTSSFTYYSFDVGTKLSLSSAWGLDIGARWRDSDKYEYKSTRYHAMLLFDVNAHNTLGLRYSQSSSDNLEEDRESIRLHWQHNF
jgi:hypothetical protein